MNPIRRVYSAETVQAARLVKMTPERYTNLTEKETLEYEDL